MRCRSWVEQKRFALAMLVVALLFIFATVIVPTVQGLLTATAEELPFGLSDVPGLLFGVTLAVGLVLLFATLCVIYWAVPNTAVPWRAIWPGAALATLAIAIVDFAFPFYLSQISTIERVGTTLVFIVIVLLWFYVLAIIVLGGAVINALRMRSRAARLRSRPLATPAAVGLLRAGRVRRPLLRSHLPDRERALLDLLLDGRKLLAALLVVAFPLSLHVTFLSCTQALPGPNVSGSGGARPRDDGSGRTGAAELS